MLELAVLPAEAARMDADCFVVIDLLRATTTIATLFEAGLRDLVVVDDIEAARTRAEEEGRLLFGEVGGLRPDGFDYGNSPVEAGEADVNGRGAVLFTTNGTRAICGVAGKGVTVAGSLANLSAVVECARGFARVAIVCAGTEGGERFAVEDFAAAGTIAHALAKASPGLDVGDACGIAMSVTGYEDWIASGLPQRTGPSARLIAGGVHGRKLVELGLGGDIRFAAQVDTAHVVPQVVDHGRGWARLEAERLQQD
jgi:2-phosphosulfolactate phosphatase